MRLLICRCSITYEGRLSTSLASGDRVILIKDDGSVCVHSQKGAKPINYMPGPTAVSEQGRTIIVHRPSSGERLVIDVEEVHADLGYELEDAAALVREGQERELQQIVFSNPAALEEGMIAIERERFTDVGPVDLICRDSDGRTVVIEIKRVRATAQAVEQLTRYVDQINLNPDCAPARGVLVAPDLAPQARVLLESRGFEFIELEGVLDRCDYAEASLRLFS